MCRQVYFNCIFCGVERFFMWEECSAFWKRYQYVVIDLDSFDERPRVSRNRHDPPACGGKLEDRKYRNFRVGSCPRLREGCPSLGVYRRQQQRQQQQQQQQQGKSATRQMSTVRGGGMVDGGKGDEVVAAEGAEEEEEDWEMKADRIRREFADRWFRKRSLGVRMMQPPPKTTKTMTRLKQYKPSSSSLSSLSSSSPSRQATGEERARDMCIEGGDGVDDSSSTGSSSSSRNHGTSKRVDATVSALAAVVVTQPHSFYRDEDEDEDDDDEGENGSQDGIGIARSMDSTVIESGSEVDSSYYLDELSKSMQGLRVDEVKGD